MTLDDSWKQLQQVNEIVRYADAKAGLILTLNGVLVGLVAVRLQSSGFFAGHHRCVQWGLRFLGRALAVVVVAAVVGVFGG
jgi:hypothetical protein